MEYYSRANLPKTLPAPAGEAEETTYSITMDEHGHKELRATGTTNVYEYIQASLEETKIDNIIRRAAYGDESALAAMHGEYIDCTTMPTSLAEMQQLIINATNEFAALPLEIRAAYNHEASQYIADYGSDHWQQVMGYKEDEKQ